MDSETESLLIGIAIIVTFAAFAIFLKMRKKPNRKQTRPPLFEQKMDSRDPDDLS